VGFYQFTQRAEIVGGLMCILLNCHDLVSFKSVEMIEEEL
jgi:hypothetical protein